VNKNYNNIFLIKIFIKKKPLSLSSLTPIFFHHQQLPTSTVGIVATMGGEGGKKGF
jgi:hypothetical protein